MSVLRSDNPFHVLKVPRFASKSDILKQVSLLSARDPKSMHVYRNAQIALFNPSVRYVFEFLVFPELPLEARTETSTVDSRELKIPKRERWKRAHA